MDPGASFRAAFGRRLRRRRVALGLEGASRGGRRALALGLGLLLLLALGILPPPGGAILTASLFLAFLVAGYALAGHVHPAVRLRGEGESLRLPCFWFGARYGVLPAFGAFTGTAEVRPREGDQVFVIAEDEVLRVG